MKARYDSLEQRIIDTYLESFPPFSPSAGAPEESQRQFHDFLRGVYQALLADPGILFDTLHEDDAYYRRFNRAAEKKPDLNKNMQAIRKKLEGLLELLHSLGRTGTAAADGLLLSGETKLTKKQLARLEALGLHAAAGCLSAPAYPLMAAGWTFLAGETADAPLRFSRCLFGPENDSRAAYDLFAPLLGSGVTALRDFCAASGYETVSFREGKLSLDYVKNYGKTAKEQAEPLKDAWAERNYAGVSMEYDFYVFQPARLCLRLPRMKELLASFDRMPEPVQRFLLRWNKRCDGCRYCVQTDKTGQRPLAAVPVAGVERATLCPIFPGYNYCWTAVDEPLAEGLIAVLRYIDEVFG